MNAAKVYSLSLSAREERGGMSRAHLHLKQHAIKQLAVDTSVFDRVKSVLFYTTIEKFEPFEPNYATGFSLRP